MWVWSQDPALDAPPADAPENVRAEWERRLDVARDTAQWEPLIKAGSKVTKFTLRIVPELLWRKLMDSLGDVGARHANATAVRLALVDVSDLDGFDNKPFKVEQKHLEGYGQAATTDILDLLAAYLRAVREGTGEAPGRPDATDPIDEMASAIARRQTGIRPLSSRG
jgi:hypothetical protein